MKKLVAIVAVLFVAHTVVLKSIVSQSGMKPLQASTPKCRKILKLMQHLNMPPKPLVTV